MSAIDALAEARKRNAAMAGLLSRWASLTNQPGAPIGSDRFAHNREQFAKHLRELEAAK